MRSTLIGLVAASLVALALSAQRPRHRIHGRHLSGGNDALAVAVAQGEASRTTDIHGARLHERAEVRHQLREGNHLGLGAGGKTRDLGRAVQRRTASGRQLGASERIGVADALRTITIGAAYTLRLDGEIGAIACGKRADFAVLEDDPETIGAESLKDVRIWGTVLGGRVQEAAAL